MNSHKRPWDLEDDGEDVDIVDEDNHPFFKDEIHKTGVDALPLPKPNSISHHSFLHDLPAPAWSENMEDVSTPWNEPEKSLEHVSHDYFAPRFRDVHSNTTPAVPAVADEKPKEKKRKLAQNRKKSKKVVVSKQSPSAQSSLFLPSHKRPWSDDEQRRFEEGVASFGRGNWKLVAEHIATRNPLQVKNHARQYFRKLEKNGVPVPPKVRKEVLKDKVGLPKQMPEEVVMTHNGGDDTSEEIDIDDDLPPPPVDPRPIIPDQMTRIYEPSSNANSQSEKSESQSQMDYGGRVFTEAKFLKDHLQQNVLAAVSAAAVQPHPEVEKPEKETHSRVRFDDVVVQVLYKSGESNVFESEHPLSDGDSRQSENSDLDDASDSLHTGDEMEEVHAEQERILSPHHADEDEKKWNSEFFCGKSVKTEDRYLTIRNFIIDCWKQRRPSYLSKTSVRTGLKDCGDVNAIGRIHTFLENVGAINFGADRPPRYRRISKKDSKKRTPLSPIDELKVGPRKRKVRSERGDWVYEDEKDKFSHMTIIHEPELRSDSKEKKRKPKDMDEYTLVPCRQFSEHASPFTVTLLTQVLIVSDLHAQLNSLEIIGLLGGRYDPFRRILQVATAVPCLASHASAFSCELDAASAAAARDLIVEELKLDVVGWYHSHPTFAPQPSLLDIQNQANYQALFAKGNVEPFVGLIVNPEHSFNSAYTLFTTMLDSQGGSRLPRLPFEVPHEVLPISQISEFFLKQLVNIVRNSLTEERLNKVFQVVTSYMYLPQELLHSLTDKLKQIFTELSHADSLQHSHQDSLQTHSLQGQHPLQVPSEALPPLSFMNGM